MGKSDLHLSFYFSYLSRNCGFWNLRLAVFAIAYKNLGYILVHLKSIKYKIYYFFFLRNLLCAKAFPFKFYNFRWLSRGQRSPVDVVDMFISNTFIFSGYLSFVEYPRREFPVERFTNFRRAKHINAPKCGLNVRIGGSVSRSTCESNAKGIFLLFGIKIWHVLYRIGRAENR